MKNIRGSIAAKIMAWILISVSAVGFLASAAGIIWMRSENVYGRSLEDARTEWYQGINDRYMIYALANLEYGTNKEFFSDKNFRYGIIEVPNEDVKLEYLDLNEEETYLERNFTEQVSEEDLYAAYYLVTENSDFYYSNMNSFLNSFAYLSSREGDWRSIYADYICYDVTGGIFYYYGDGMYYPVQHIRMEQSGLNFSYDFDRKMYRREQSTEAIESTETIQATEEEPLTGGQDDTMDAEQLELVSPDDILNQEYLTFNMLNNTTLNYKNFGMLMLDHVREVDMEEIKQIDSDYIVPNSFSKLQDYYLDANYTLQVNNRSESPGISYWVVCLTPKGVGTGFGSSDLYEQANAYLEIAYRMRYVAVGILFLCFIIGVLSFLYLMSDAGYRKNLETVKTTFVDIIPLDLYLLLVFLVEITIMFFMVECGNGLNDPVLIGMICMAGALCMGWLLLIFLLSVSVRVKLGEWWKNTVLYLVIYRFLAMIWENFDILWNAIFVMVGLAGIEFIGMLLVRVHTVAIFCWFLEKLILYPIILFMFVQMRKLKDGGERIANGEPGYKIDTKGMFREFKKHGETINNISEGMSHAVTERMKSEHFKTELITNVSHDIKTPLTSIINYVDLLEKEELNNENAKEYLEVLDRQSGRLKKLIEDLIEASKASTGNLAVHLERLEAGIFMVQTIGEFEEKTAAAGLELIINKPENPIYIMADSKHFWRVIDNLMNNICKYAQHDTRVYINLEKVEQQVVITFRNTSKFPLNISSDELMERFVRGDSSRNTEGSGLGLSIANSLMDLMGGSFKLYVDGDLFKVILGFQEAEEKTEEETE